MNMSGMTISQALARVDSLRRERLSHLRIAAGAQLQMTCHPHPSAGVPFGGPLTAAVPLAEQLVELERSGLVGDCSSSQETSGEARVELWGTGQARQDWETRVALSLGSQQAAEILRAAGDLKKASWEREQAMARIQENVWALSSHKAVSASDMIRIAQIARATFYSMLKAMPAGYVAPAIQRADEPHLDSQSSSSTVPEAPAPRELVRPAEERPRTVGSAQPVPELVRMPTGHTAPCVVCATDAIKTLHGVPIHGGQCLINYLEREVLAPAPTPTHEASPPPASPVPSARKEPAVNPSRSGPGARAKKRFRALAAALDAEWLYLPGGEKHHWRSGHLGDLAELTRTYNLGHGGGKTLPARGEIYLYPGALERLGLPATVDLDDMLMGDERTRKQREAAFAPLNKLPPVAAALADGWDLGAGRLDAIVRIQHEDHRRGARLIFVPWSWLAGIPLFTDDEGHLVDPGTLVDRAQQFADHVGVPFNNTAGNTGFDLIDHTRPPRASADEPMPDSGASPVKFEAGEIPPFLRDSRDTRFTMIESNYSWWRTWASLTPDDRALTYVHAYDHRSHYLNPWGNVYLGLEGLQHLIGSDARWSGDERASYYLVSRWDQDWPDWRLPDPFNALPAVVSNDRVWVTSHTLKQLDKLAPGLTDSLTYHEAYTWKVQAQYLAGAARILRDARNSAPEPVAATVKAVYSSTTQKFASRDLMANHHLRRPDFRDIIQAASRTAMVATIMDGHQNPAAPATLLVADRDTLVYASADPDPRSAWPGRPGKLEDLRGGWRPIGSGLLAQWGPTALEPRSGRWQYAAHMGLLNGVPGRAPQPTSQPH